MGDISIAKNVLETYNLSLVVVKDEKIIYQSADEGIKSFLEALITEKDSLASSSVADKVIGLSLAHLLVFAKVSKAYAELISEGAKDFLEKNDITVKYRLIVPFILNKTMDNLCIFEKMAESFTSADDAFEKINTFLLRPRAQNAGVPQ